jgi:hypothetical protein
MFDEHYSKITPKGHLLKTRMDVKTQGQLKSHSLKRHPSTIMLGLSISHVFPVPTPGAVRSFGVTPHYISKQW